MTNLQVYLKLLACVGAIALCTVTSKVLRFIYLYTRPSSISRYHHNHSNSSAPPWAIVTGASDGIGKQYCYALADKDFNVVLHGRNSVKLHHVRHDLQNEYPHLEFRIVLADTSVAGPESIKHIHDIVESLKDIHVTVLVNNVGTEATPHSPNYCLFQDYTPEDLDCTLNTNIRFAMQFTRAVLPLLLSHGGPSLILNMGSMGDFGMPYLGAYPAAKKAMMGFSSMLKLELEMQKAPVEVLGIMTGEVTDTAHTKDESNLMVPKAAVYARSALDRVGCGEEVVCGYWLHGIAWAVVPLFPRLFKGYIKKEAARSLLKSAQEWDDLKH